MPIVSVIILTKNRTSLLEKALLSVSAQSFKDKEIIVVNDGSTDTTESVLQQFISNGLPIKIITHTASLGISASRQEALLLALGKYVALLDDDDEWATPEKLQLQVDYCTTNPNIVLVGGGRFVKDSNDAKLFRPEQDEAIRETMLLKNPFFTSTVLFNRKAAMQAGGFISDGKDYVEDYDLWIRLGLLGKMYNFPIIFDKYRVPSYTTETFRQYLIKQYALVKKYGKPYPRYYISLFVWNCRLLLFPLLKH